MDIDVLSPGEEVYYILKFGEKEKPKWINIYKGVIHHVSCDTHKERITYNVGDKDAPNCARHDIDSEEIFISVADAYKAIQTYVEKP